MDCYSGLGFPNMHGRFIVFKSNQYDTGILYYWSRKTLLFIKTCVIRILIVSKNCTRLLSLCKIFLHFFHRILKFVSIAFKYAYWFCLLIKVRVKYTVHLLKYHECYNVIPTPLTKSYFKSGSYPYLNPIHIHIYVNAMMAWLSFLKNHLIYLFLFSLNYFLF